MTEPGRIIKEMHATMKRLHVGGFIDERRMRELEALYRANQVLEYSGENVYVEYTPPCQNPPSLPGNKNPHF